MHALRVRDALAIRTSTRCSKLPGRTRGRDLADAVHLLCSLHGRYPGLVELALAALPQGRCSGLADPRLGRLRARAALPRPPDFGGRPDAEHAGRGRDRVQPGCGAPRARDPGDVGAERLRARRCYGSGRRLVADPPRCSTAPRRASAPKRRPRRCPTKPRWSAIIDTRPENPASARALAFGGEQLLLQHRALFDLLEARAEARGDY